MFTDEDRKELLKYIDSVHRQMRSVVESKRVLPSSITYNGSTVGATIEIRKIYEKPDVDYSGEDH